MLYYEEYVEVYDLVVASGLQILGDAYILRYVYVYLRTVIS